MFCDFRDGVQSAMDEYVGRKFHPGTTRANVYFNADGLLQIEIACINLKLDSFWGGEWQSTWQIDTSN
jgi:hypothetical protein